MRVNETDLSAPRISQILSSSPSLCTAANQNTNQSTNHRQLLAIENQQHSASLLIPHTREPAIALPLLAYSHTREPPPAAALFLAYPPTRSTPSHEQQIPTSNTTRAAPAGTYLPAEAAPACTFSSPPPPLQPPKQLKLEHVRHPQLPKAATHTQLAVQLTPGEQSTTSSGIKDSSP
jgi:hypothetical protein